MDSTMVFDENLKLGSASETAGMISTLSDFLGPFFLGYAFEMFALGILLVLCSSYFVSVFSHKRNAADSSRWLGMTLVLVSLIINTAQTVVDLYRGYIMFALNFANLLALLHPSALFFVSPFLSLFPALITQAFLLRRTMLFISSLSSFWPRLASRPARIIFAVFMTLLILFSFGAGTVAAVLVWKSGNLYTLYRGDLSSIAFQRAELLWLATSSGVDLLLSFVLCFELWWARSRLATQGGHMRQVVTRLMIVTFHGGLAVTAIQLTTLFLYQFSSKSAWCYFPMLFLPKIYTITLVLSLSLPQSKTPGPSPSHVFSLPTIQANDSVSPYSVSSPSQPTPASPNPSTAGLASSSGQNGPDTSSEKGDYGKEDQEAGFLRTNVMGSWRRSQSWLGWSLVGQPRTFQRRPSQTRSEKTPKDLDLESHPTFRPWSRQEDVSEAGTSSEPVLPSLAKQIDSDYSRRPSDPNSLAPLLNATSQRRPSTLVTSTSSPTSEVDMATAQESTYDPLSPQIQPLSAAIAPTPSNGSTIDRNRPISRRASLPIHTTGSPVPVRGSSTAGSGSSRQNSAESEYLTPDTGLSNPGIGRTLPASVGASAIRTAQRNTRPSSSPTEQTGRTDLGSRRGLQGHGKDEDALSRGPDDDNTRGGRERGGSGMCSFEDMLEAGPEGFEGARRSDGGQ